MKKLLSNSLVSTGENNARDYLIIWLMGSLLAVYAYQPAYFGDELFPFYLAKHSSSLWQTFTRINEYKPRYVFDWFWAVLSWYKVPRSETFFLNTSLICISASLAFKLAKIIGARTGNALLVGLIIVTSRFGCVFLFDYLSGLIANIALSSFLIVLILLYKLLGSSTFDCRRFLVIFGMSIFTIFVYETYVAALFAVGIALAIKSWQLYRQDIKAWKAFIFASISVWLIPLLLFLLANKLSSSLPATTGTSGIPVTVGWDTVETFFRYDSNVLLGSNYGKDWLVGALNTSSTVGVIVITLFGILFASVWSMYLLEFFRGRLDRRWAGIFAILIFGMTVISSLPGSEHADGRWMYPVAAFSGLIAVTARKQVIVKLILSVIMTCNVCYFLLGSHLGIYNINSSYTAGQLVRSIGTIVPNGKRGIVLDGPQLQMRWILGGDKLQGNTTNDGDVFCDINLPKGPCLDPESALKAGTPIDGYNFGLVFLPVPDVGAKFRLVSNSAIRVLTDYDSSAALESTVLGGEQKGWSAWSYVKDVRFLDTDLLLHPDFSSFLHVDARSLDDKILSYSARLTSKTRSTMRLQINWSDAKGKFISTQIKVVQLTPAFKNYTMFLDRPNDAVNADVYARLHDGAVGNVDLKSVSVMTP